MKVEKSTSMAGVFHFNCGSCCGADCYGLVKDWKLWTFQFRRIHHMGYLRVKSALLEGMKVIFFRDIMKRKHLNV